MFSASPQSRPTAKPGHAGLPLERRLSAEWALLHELAARNPQRIANIRSYDLCFRLRLLQTPGLVAAENAAGAERILSEHDVRIVFPRFFPAVPMELYLGTPVHHPNVHPETGFVCLWDRHRVSHTVEHAVHKLAAMLGWKLWNGEAVHVMQPDALRRVGGADPVVVASLAAAPLLGVERSDTPVGFPSALERERVVRRRLS